MPIKLRFSMPLEYSLENHPPTLKKVAFGMLRPSPRRAAVAAVNTRLGDLSLVDEKGLCSIRVNLVSELSSRSSARSLFHRE